jgi:transcriptional regulator GlxA family with amidase domain
VAGDARALVRERGVRSARLQTVLDRLATDAVEPSLAPATFAASMGMSVRYLHRLLEPTGRSFSEHLLKARLDRAAAMLRDPDFAELRIAEIAAEAGFVDISHFNRSFRRVFGDTPLGMRAGAARRYAH